MMKDLKALAAADEECASEQKPNYKKKHEELQKEYRKLFAEYKQAEQVVVDMNRKNLHLRDELQKAYTCIANMAMQLHGGGADA